MAHETPPGEPTEEQRLAAFREELSAPTRDGRRALRPTIPPAFVWGVVATFVILGLGGAVFEHFYGNVGQPSAPTTTVATSLTTTSLSSTTLPTTTSAFIGLREIASAPAPAIALLDQSGHRWTLTGQRGRVVLVTFYDTKCADVCPVLGTEIREALEILARSRVPVDVAVVNTNPHVLADTTSPAALVVPGLLGRPDVQFLTGMLRQLNSVWSSYGVSVTVGAKPDEIAHNNVLYFVDPRGRLRALATPFANESRAAIFTLPRADEQRFAQGVATEASSLSR